MTKEKKKIKDKESKSYTLLETCTFHFHIQNPTILFLQFSISHVVD